jgi:hypothetical protein
VNRSRWLWLALLAVLCIVSQLGAAHAAVVAMDLTYYETYASFTVTSFCGYAVTAVPEPATTRKNGNTKRVGAAPLGRVQATLLALSRFRVFAVAR